MTNTNKTTAPMTLAELKAWVKETCELSELLQTKDYKNYPSRQAITFRFLP